MGLITVDVSPLGIVVAGDSQPINLYESSFEIPSGKPRTVNPVVRASLGDFSGFAAYVGTEIIGDQPAREWLRTVVKNHSSSTLPALCQNLADELTEIWTTGALTTHLSIFVARYEGADARFWFVSNGEGPGLASGPMPLVFEAVDDIDGRFRETNAQPGESQQALIARTMPSFRRGLLAAGNIFNSFTNLLGQTIQEGHPEVRPITTLERYAAYVRFRFEFTKRIYDPKYGIGVGAVQPVAGTIHVYSVDPTGIAREHGKHLAQTRIVT